ncbi:uncharacterized protein [Paramisgurnus dabryanus]|uniref:uncharacterized protein n=1 Tax=Paramisgurnus dabryanus TaxID=90735 RepID=UPI0031F3EDC4
MMMMMMMMKAMLAGCVIIWLFPSCGVCFSLGASVSSCVNMKPGHIRSLPLHTHTHTAITIRSSRSVYLPQHTLTVTVQSSRAFMGFLLQARSVLEDRVVGGEFTLHPASTHTLSCLNPDDTVTHSDKMLKRNLSFSWRAPPQPSGDLRFYITLVQSYFVYWARIRSAVVRDGTQSPHIIDGDTTQHSVNVTASILEQRVQNISLSTHTTTSTHTSTLAPYNTHNNILTTFNTHGSTHSQYNTQTNTLAPYNTQTNTPPTFNTHTSIHSQYNTHPTLNTHTNTLAPYNTETNTHPTFNTHTSVHSQNNTHTNTLIPFNPQTLIHAPYTTHTNTPEPYHTHTISPIKMHTLIDTQTSQSTSTQPVAVTPSLQNTYSSPNTKTTSHINNTQTFPDLLLHTDIDTSSTQQTLHTHIPNKHNVQTSHSSHTHPSMTSHTVNPFLHPKPSPASRRFPSDLFPSQKPTKAAVSLSHRPRVSLGLPRDLLKPPDRAKDPPGAPEKGGEKPERVPSQSSPELGLLLGLSTALGMAIAVGLRYLQKKHCRKRTAISLNDRNHDNRGIIHVQECGDLVQVRKIRQNSFLVLQAEYDLITPPGN